MINTTGTVSYAMAQMCTLGRTKRNMYYTEVLHLVIAKKAQSA